MESKEKKKRVSVLSFYKQYALLIFISITFLAGQAICELQLPEYMSNIVSQGIAVSDMDKVVYWGLWMIGLTLLGSVFSVVVSYLSSKISASVARDLRKACFDKVMAFAGEEYNKFDLASLITRSTNDVTQLQNFTNVLLRMIMMTPIMGIGGIVKSVKLGSGMGNLAWVIVVAVLIIFVAIALLLMIAQPKFMKMQKAIDDVNQVANDELTGMMVIRAFNTQPKEQQRFDAANRYLTGLSLFANRTMVTLMPLMTLVMNAVSIAIVWIAAYAAQDITQVANMMAFIQYATHIIMSFMLISMVFVLIPRASVSAKRINEILATEVSIVNKEGNETPVGVRVVGDVEFKDVAYSYGGDNAVEHISFVAEHGKTTALIGSTGSGKSTIINMIPRLIDATEGEILIDSVNVKDYNLKDLRANVGFVPQKNYLFSGTIASNVGYGSTNDEQTLNKSIDIAQARHFVDNKENGLQSEIAQGGGNVSGGQKQRLSIARALSKNAPIYIFDDSFSALDFKTDKALREALGRELSDATIIIVAQRVGTIKNADQIIVLDDGKIVGKGKHEDLLRTCDIYREIAKSQLSEEELGL
ncbi:MAG: ABC transporter ATP-binding protein [Christensenellales bacterium]